MIPFVTPQQAGVWQTADFDPLSIGRPIYWPLTLVKGQYSDSAGSSVHEEQSGSIFSLSSYSSWQLLPWIDKKICFNDFWKITTQKDQKVWRCLLQKRLQTIKAVAVWGRTEVSPRNTEPPSHHAPFSSFYECVNEQNVCVCCSNVLHNSTKESCFYQLSADQEEPAPSHTWSHKHLTIWASVHASNQNRAPPPPPPHTHHRCWGRRTGTNMLKSHLHKH